MQVWAGAYPGAAQLPNNLALGYLLVLLDPDIVQVAVQRFQVGIVFNYYDVPELRVGPGFNTTPAKAALTGSPGGAEISIPSCLNSTLNTG
jgi:hypothetical protein